jgi:hypothetical protein
VTAEAQMQTLSDIDIVRQLFMIDVGVQLHISWDWGRLLHRQPNTFCDGEFHSLSSLRVGCISYT